MRLTQRRFWLAAAALAAAVVVSHWPSRAHFLFSWDSANYALAMERIDIRLHRPHPPGYLAYVVVARGLNTVTRDPNAALILWNVIAAVLIALIVLRVAWEIGWEQPRPIAFVVAASTMVATSPLLWFYSDVAEIYPSELLATSTLGFCAWRSLRGRPRAIYELAVMLPIAACFKLTAALLMSPLALYAWRRAAPGARIRAAVLLLACSAAAGVCFVASAPGIVDIIWNQFVTSTSHSRLVATDGSNPLERLNRNGRDTLTATVSLLGAVNVLAFLAWLIGDRRLPRGIDRNTTWLWTSPWLFLCIVVHIAKPGYVVPLLPVAALIVAGFYSRSTPALGISLIVLQAAVNIGQFAIVRPFSDATTGSSVPYRARTVTQRVASDLNALTFPTLATIRINDDAVKRVLSAATENCPTKDPVIIGALEPTDVRRVTWYLPRATVVHTESSTVVSYGSQGLFHSLGAAPVVLHTHCYVLWLASDRRPPEIPLPTTAVKRPGIGFVIDAGSVELSPKAISIRR